MANLVTVTREGRLLLKIGAAIFGVLFTGYIIFQGATLFKALLFPDPPPAPKEEFGKLPHISFPSQGTPGIEFRVNTIDGKLPNFPDRLNVYKLKKPEPNLLALESARKTLDSQEFSDNQVKLSETLYQWNQLRSGATIQYDIVTKHFIITSNYLYNPSQASNGTMPDEEKIKNDVYGFVDSMSESIENLDKEKTKVEYLELQNNSLVPADNITKARYARVTLQQISVDEYGMIYDTPTDSILNFVISYPPGGFMVLEGEFYNHEPDLEQKSDYPIKTAAQAIEDLKQGNAYMIYENNLSTIDITNIELRYYLNKDSADYLLPVIVLTGIDEQEVEFTGYVEAIPSTSLAN